MNDADFMRLIERMRAQGTDDAFVEAKAAAESLPKSVWETVSSFGNTHGGVIVLGVDDCTGFAPVQSFPLERVRDQFVSGIGDGGADNAFMVNPPQYELERKTLDGEQVLVIEIAETDPLLKPSYIKRKGVMNGSFKRIDDKDVKLSTSEIYALQTAFVPSPADREIVTNATESDLDPAIVDSILLAESVRHARSMARAASREERMQRLNIVDARGDVLLCGLLAAGTYPQQFFPRFMVDVAVYPGTKKGTGGSVRYLDRVVCEGPLHQVIDDASVATARNLRTAGVVETVARVDEPEIPHVVIREAIANAVVHRDYSTAHHGRAVTVDVFTDRVVVQSPGGLWGGKTLANIGDGVSRCRNGALMRIAQSLPSTPGFGPPSEGAGTGIPLMVSEMAAAGLAKPLFEADFDSFRVTLFRPGFPLQADQAVSSEAREREGDDAIVYFDRTAEDAPERSEIEYAVIDLLENESPLSIREIAEGVGVPLWTARRCVRRLIDRNDVAATAAATSRNRRYRLAGQRGIERK